MVLHENPTDYFAQVEQLAFSPSHMIPGIEPSPDKMLQARLFSYPDTHRHRLGANYQQIPVNMPLKANNYQRDGPMTVTDNGGGMPNYFPNTFNGPSTSSNAVAHADTVTGDVERVETGGDDNDNFTQCGHFFNNVLSHGERDRLTSNIAGHMVNASETIRMRAISNFAAVDPVYGRKIKEKIDVLIKENGGEMKRRVVAAPLNPPRNVPSGDKLVCPYALKSKL
mmetsp:Transcript_4518/g.6883  ORF Transcript_4518/g.6883 Transcript_4518/m.6883 type:complete len:225 (+) Transcript_4518:1-675(+)